MCYYFIFLPPISFCIITYFMFYVLCIWHINKYMKRLSPALRREAEQQEKNNARHQALMDHMRAAAQDEKAAAWQSEAPLENSKSA